MRLAPEGIGVFEVRPGIVATDMTAPVAERYGSPHPRGARPGTPLGDARGRRPRAVVAVCDGRLGFATGSVIQADGGLSIGRL